MLRINASSKKCDDDIPQFVTLKNMYMKYLLLCLQNDIRLFNSVYFSPLMILERAEKQGQSLTKVPYRETFWKGTMRTRPRTYYRT